MGHKINKELYSQFLLSTFGRHSACWLAELLDNQPAHDTLTRWLAGTKLRPRIIWEYVKEWVDPDGGYLILDDTVLDKFYAKDMELVQHQWSGTHHRVVKGIGLVNLLWNLAREPDQAEHIIIDFRIYGKKYDGKTKNQHARDMMSLAHQRGLRPQAVLMDSWYASLDNLKLIRQLGWLFITDLESDRQLSLLPHQYRPVPEVATPTGTICHLKGFGAIKAFKLVLKNGDIKCLATNDLSLSAPDVRKAAIRRWKIEETHRGAKQVTGVECCQARNQRAQRNHILCGLLAFLALEKYRLETGVSWYQAKQQVIAHALKQYLKQPLIPLSKTVAPTGVTNPG